MIIYNVTINIDESAHDQWLNWLRTKHIGEVLATGCFYKAKLSRVLVEEEMGGVTYSVQYFAESNEKLQAKRKCRNCIYRTARRTKRNRSISWQSLDDLLRINIIDPGNTI